MSSSSGTKNSEFIYELSHPEITGVTQSPLYFKVFFLLPLASRDMEPAKAAPYRVLALAPFWREQHGAATRDSLYSDTDYNVWHQPEGWSGYWRRYPSQPALRLRHDRQCVRLGRDDDRGLTHRYQYDRAGNLVTDSIVGGVVWTYGYDNLDRLVSARRNGTVIARYGYDVLGRRIVKRVYPAAGTPNVGYLRMVYTGDAVAFETDSAGTIGLRYTWGPGADNLLAIQDESGNHYYATTDRLGSVRSLAKRDGTWLLTRRWTPYGSALSRDSSASFTWGGRLRYGWTGREHDAETGLYFHRARYYAPALRRFIQEDPVESSTSAYAYVNGSPLEATDPSGMIMSYEMRMTDFDLSSKLSVTAASTTRLAGLLGWGQSVYEALLGQSSGGSGSVGSDAGSPSAKSDTTEVGCRPVHGAGGIVANHCAVRVGANDDKQAGELLDSDGSNRIVVFDGTGEQAGEYTWTVVPAPEGLNVQQFDLRVMRAFNAESSSRNGLPYSSHSSVNSNQFVFTIIETAGGTIPRAAVPNHGLTPGLCGGGGRFDLGTHCSP